MDGILKLLICSDLCQYGRKLVSPHSFNQLTIIRTAKPYRMTDEAPVVGLSVYR